MYKSFYEYLQEEATQDARLSPMAQELLDFIGEQKFPRNNRDEKTVLTWIQQKGFTLYKFQLLWNDYTAFKYTALISSKADKIRSKADKIRNSK